RSIRRASNYGRVRVPHNEQELIRFRDRVVAPAASRLAAIPLKISKKTNVDAISAKIVAAGLAPRLSAPSFLAIKGATTIGGALFGLMIGAVGSVGFGLLMAPACGGLGFIGPDWFLTMKLRSRRESVRSELPDALDLLAVSVEAGLGFDAAVTKLTEHMKGPLIDEFALTLNEIRVGETRAVALRKMADRVDAPELSNFVRAVVQAEQLGISLGRILRVQAADTRLRRQSAAEEKAMKVPIKMLFPTILFIFPSMFIVILGPAFINIVKVFSS
ncbi:MAG TPA: type II secretion system F family protein, partial [Gaiellaceae bacterium]|nr:type II secretion system F family protein [Gaiellaceae bacterium]